MHSSDPIFEVKQESTMEVKYTTNNKADIQNESCTIQKVEKKYPLNSSRVKNIEDMLTYTIQIHCKKRKKKENSRGLIDQGAGLTAGLIISPEVNSKATKGSPKIS